MGRAVSWLLSLALLAAGMSVGPVSAREEPPIEEGEAGAPVLGRFQLRQEHVLEHLESARGKPIEVAPLLTPSSPGIREALPWSNGGRGVAHDGAAVAHRLDHVPDTLPR